MQSKFILIVTLIIFLIIVLIIFSSRCANNYESYSIKNDCIKNCVISHSENGLNYPWLNHIYGGLIKIKFEEPPNSGDWKDYNEDIWKIHCKVINHNPINLVDAHVNAFINPNTRFAKLEFYFKDGTIMEPIIQFYELEKQWFEKYKICN